jgi:L-gulonate 3-dehydrogenase
VEQIAIVGSGLIGRAWTVVFARAGHRVRVWDQHPPAVAAAIAQVRSIVDELHAARLIDDPAAIVSRVAPAATLEEALDGAGYAQESTAEDVEVKREVFARMDAGAAPACVLASSTSSIPASAFTRDLAGKARCLVAHPVNPPHLVPVVELCGAPWTSADTLARARTVYKSVGQVPVTVKREVEGFILNRLQGALLAEAFRLVADGYVSPQDLDHTIKNGLGLRWSFMGPFETIELNAPGGMPDYCARYTGFYKRLQAKPATPAAYSDASVAEILTQWGQPATPERISKRMQWRDARLAALAAHKKTQQSS